MLLQRINDNMGRLSLIQKIAGNPAFGLIPMLVFSLLVTFTGMVVATGIALVLSLMGFFCVKKPVRLIYQVSLITFLVAFVLSLFAIGNQSLTGKFLVVEIIFLFLLIIARLSRSRIVTRLARKQSVMLKNYMKETMRVAFQAHYGLTIHLFVVMVLLLLGVGGSFDGEHRWVLISAQLVLLTVIILETGRLHLLFKKLHKEEWLPVVTEQGDVTGKVAKSITKELKNKFMHPVVRVALIYRGTIYLRERESTRLLNPGMLDYPFEKYMKYDHEIDESVHNSISYACGSNHIPLRFLLKYVFENESTKRLIFLYVSDIEDEELFNSLQLKGGKLWTEAQIEDNMGTGLFSECFEMEFEYLKNTILLAHRFRTRMGEKQ